MSIEIGDIIEFKKPHPCGGKAWRVLRIGMDFKLKCEVCGREIMLTRQKAEKSAIRIIKDGSR